MKHLPHALASPPLQLPTGVPGLDDVLGGGIPEGSCTAIVGGPGTGKTTLAQQILFSTASSGRTGIYFAGPGESQAKVLRHQQQLSFFHRERLDSSVYLASLSQAVVDGDPNHVLQAIAREVEDRHAAFVIVDLVQALTPASLWKDMAFYLSRCEITSVLIADCEPPDTPPTALLSTADAVLWLRHSLTNGIALHTLHAPKIRGQQPLPGLHPVRLTWDGMQVFPRWPLAEPRMRRARPPERISAGFPELDALLGGGIPAGDTLLVEGDSGTGKSVLATQFVAANGQRGEPSVVLLFEERPDRFLDRAETLELGLERLVEHGMVEVLSFRGRDLSPDEVIHTVRQAVKRVVARCVVIDSTAGLELALSGGGGLRDCLWRLLDSLSGAGVTVWLNSTGEQPLGALVDDVLELRRVEHDGRVGQQLRIQKMRSSSHARESRGYEIGAHGVALVQRELFSKRRNGANGHAVNGVNGPALTLKHTA